MKDDLQQGKKPLLRDRIWPEDKSRVSKEAKLSKDLPLSYRLWPDTWPPEQLLDLPPTKAVREELDRLFCQFYEQHVDDWE